MPSVVCPTITTATGTFCTWGDQFERAREVISGLQSYTRIQEDEIRKLVGKRNEVLVLFHESRLAYAQQDRDITSLLAVNETVRANCAAALKESALLRQEVALLRQENALLRQENAAVLARIDQLLAERPLYQGRSLPSLNAGQRIVKLTCVVAIISY